MDLYDVAVARKLSSGGGGGGGSSDFDYMHKVDVYSFDADTETVVLDITGAELYVATGTQYFELTEEQRAYFSTNEFRYFYRIARNFQTRSLNVDSCSVYFFGVLRGSRI